MEATLALKTLEVLASGKELVIEGRTIAMTEDGDLVSIASNDHGNVYHMRMDLTVGQWIQYIGQLSDEEKLSIFFQGSINKV